MNERVAETVTVDILDKEYLIGCPANEREDLLKAALLLNQRLKDIREHGKVMGTERLVIMAALNMANELTKLASRDAGRHAPEAAAH